MLLQKGAAHLGNGGFEGQLQPNRQKHNWNRATVLPGKRFIKLGTCSSDLPIGFGYTATEQVEEIELELEEQNLNIS